MHLPQDGLTAPLAAEGGHDPHPFPSDPLSRRSRLPADSSARNLDGRRRARSPHLSVHVAFQAGLVPNQFICQGKCEHWPTLLADYLEYDVRHPLPAGNLYGALPRACKTSYGRTQSQLLGRALKQRRV